MSYKLNNLPITVINKLNIWQLCGAYTGERIYKTIADTVQALHALPQAVASHAPVPSGGCELLQVANTITTCERRGGMVPCQVPDAIAQVHIDVTT